MPILGVRNINQLHVDGDLRLDRADDLDEYLLRAFVTALRVTPISRASAAFPFDQSAPFHRSSAATVLKWCLRIDSGAY